jgi:hypothetical protein
MRAVLQVSPSPTEWFDDAENPKLVRLYTKLLIDSAILTTEKRSVRDILCGLIEIENETSKDIIAAFLSSTILAKRHKQDDSQHVDFRVGFWEDALTTVDDLIDGEKIKSLIEQRDPEIKVGESIVEVFSRTVGPFIDYVDHVVIADPYAGKAIASNNSSRLWLIQKLIESKIERIHIYTGVPDIKGVDSVVGLQRMRSKASLLLGAYPSYAGKITFHVYEPNSLLFHNRRFALGIDDKKICLLLEKGTDTFGTKKIREFTKLATISNKGFQDHMAAIKSSLKHHVTFEIENDR